LAAPLTCRALEERDYPKWNQLVASSSLGSPYSTPEYLEALCAATGGSFRILALDRGGELWGGIALYEESSRFGPFVSDRKLLFYNGLVLRETPTKYPSQKTARQVELLEALELGLARTEYASLRFKSRAALTDVRPFLAKGWTPSLAYSYVVPIADTAAAWERVEQNLRRLVSRAEKSGISFVEDQDFESFYRLHEQTHVRKGAPLYLPFDAFSRWFRALSGKGLCRLYHARMPDGRAIASQLVLTGAHPVTHTLAAAADGEFQHLGGNPFLRWNAFVALSKLGYQGNDLTDASLNPVTHFKSQLGGNLETAIVLARPEKLAFRAERWARGFVQRLREGARPAEEEERERPTPPAQAASVAPAPPTQAPAAPPPPPAAPDSPSPPPNRPRKSLG